MTAARSIPATCNEAWGFWGTMDVHAKAAWPLAMTAVSKATGQSLDSIRIFLDSRHGRHFADDVRNGLFSGLPLLEAIDAAIQKWMGWQIDRQTSKQCGIPRGLPYLTGFVIHSTIRDEVAVA